MNTISIKIESDERGYFDRECPNEECKYRFKVLMEDWENKVSDEVHCPLCGQVAPEDEWWTQDQLERIQEIAKSWALNYIQETIGKEFKKLERQTRHNKFVSFKYDPGVRVSFVNNPIGQSPEWETEICCEKCGTHYSVIGSAFFCPCCGFNSATNSFNDSLDSIQKMLDSVNEMRILLANKYSEDTAETMCRGLIESSIGDMVSAFQKFACSVYEDISGNKARNNDFQIVDKGSKLFEDATSHKYSDWLTASELDLMKILFQKRHILEHNNGIVDQKYIDNSNDTNYAVGQRIVVKAKDAYSLLKILYKLGVGLKELKNEVSANGNN